MTQFEEKVKDLFARHEALITRKNEPVAESNGVYTRYKSSPYARLLAVRPRRTHQSLPDGTHRNERRAQFGSN